MTRFGWGWYNLGSWQESLVSEHASGRLLLKGLIIRESYLAAKVQGHKHGTRPAGLRINAMPLRWQWV